MKSLFLLAAGLALASVAQAATLEIPTPNTTHSGIGVISGWKCEANGPLTVRFDGGPALPLAYGNTRTDTQGICGDKNNGFVSIMNWGNLGDGQHTAVAYDNGVEFDRTTFQVVTPGVDFLRHVTGQGTATLSNGQTVRLEWSEASQAFVAVAFTRTIVFNPTFSSFDWDGPSTEEIRDKLEPVYTLLVGAFGLTELNYPLEIHRRSNPPPRITLGSINGETTYRIGLFASRDSYGDYTYQFAHELAHALTNGYLAETRRYRWFDETLAEMASQFMLREFAKDPPYADYTREYWQFYADWYDLIHQDRLDTAEWQVTSDDKVADWFVPLGYQDVLAADPYIRELNWLIAREILPFFQTDPSLWRACGYLNTWDISADLTFSDYLDSWHAVLVQEGESTALISILRRILYGN